MIDLLTTTTLTAGSVAAGCLTTALAVYANRQRRLAATRKDSLAIVKRRLFAAERELADYRDDTAPRPGLPDGPRVMRAARAALREMQRTGALDNPGNHPLAMFLCNPMAAPVHGDIALVTLVTAIVDAWHSEPAGEPDQPEPAAILRLPVQTLASIAAEAQANAALGIDPKNPDQTFAGFKVKLDPYLPPNVMGFDTGDCGKMAYMAKAMDGLAGFGSSAAAALADLDKRRREAGGQP